MFLRRRRDDVTRKPRRRCLRDVTPYTARKCVTAVSYTYTAPRFISRGWVIAAGYRNEKAVKPNRQSGHFYIITHRPLYIYKSPPPPSIRLQIYQVKNDQIGGRSISTYTRKHGGNKCSLRYARIVCVYLMPVWPVYITLRVHTHTPGWTPSGGWPTHFSCVLYIWKPLEKKRFRYSEREELYIYIEGTSSNYIYKRSWCIKKQLQYI